MVTVGAADADSLVELVAGAVVAAPVRSSLAGARITDDLSLIGWSEDWLWSEPLAVPLVGWVLADI